MNTREMTAVARANILTFLATLALTCYFTGAISVALGSNFGSVFLQAYGLIFATLGAAGYLSSMSRQRALQSMLAAQQRPMGQHQRMQWRMRG